MKTLLAILDGKTKVVRSESYNYNFDIATGLFQRWGKTTDDVDNPEFSPISPEIADIEITTSCKGPKLSNGKNKLCQFCSPAGTEINTPHGSIFIENLKRGDLVMGFDTTTNSIKIQTVENTYERFFEGELICIELSNGKILKLTPNHKIFTKNKGWIECKDLIDTDEIISF